MEFLHTKNFRNCFIIAVVAWVILGLFTTIFLKIFGFGYSDTAGLSQLSLCGKDRQMLTISQNGAVSISNQEFNQAQYDVCGLLETDGRPALLTITIRDAKGGLVSVTPPGMTFEPGYIYWQIPLARTYKSGDYEIAVFWNKYPLASLSLRIIDP